MSQQGIARQPPPFTRGKYCFDGWFEMFTNYATIVGKEKKDWYPLLLTFCDLDAFTLVSNLKLNSGEKDAIDGEQPYAKIKGVLDKDTSIISPQIRLMRRKQKPDEDLTTYASEILKLANLSFNEKDVQKNKMVIEAFITGVANDNLSIHLLKTKYDSLQAAVEDAKRYNHAYETRKFVKDESTVVFTEEVFANKTFESEESDKPGPGGVESQQVNTTATTSQNFQMVQKPKNDQVRGMSHESFSKSNFQSPLSNYQQSNANPWYHTSNPQLPHPQAFNYYEPRPRQNYGGQQALGYRNPRVPRNFERAPRQQSTVTCFFCGYQGHIKPECRYLKLMQQKFGAETISQWERQSKNGPRPN